MVYIGILIFTIVLFLFFGSFFLYFKEKKNIRELRVLLNNSEDLIYLYCINPVERFEYVSDSALKLSGYSPQEFYQDADLFIKLVHPDDYPLLEFIKEYPLLNNKPIIMRWVKKDGSIIWTEQRHVNILDKKNKKIAIEGFIRNITHQKYTEFALRETKKVFRELLNNANDGIFLYEFTADGLSGKFIEINDIATKWLNYTKEEFLKKSFKDIIAYPETLINIMKEFTDKKKISYQTYLKGKNHDLFPAEISATSFKFEGAPVVLSITRDISVRKKMEEELLKSQKLESLSLLSGGIAHDFNNSLAAILGNLSLAKFYIDNQNKLSEIFSETERAILRAKDLTNQLLTFSKGGTPIKKTASIAELFRETAVFSLRGSNISPQFLIDDHLSLVDIDKSQISQVINNLVINARQAMPDGGILKASAHNIYLKDEEIPFINKGHYIKISIADTGQGIPESDIPKIFDPFFTTKQKGNGLGLAISYSIIKKHGGHILVHSEINKGTVFHIYLRVSEKKDQSEENISTDKKEVKSGHGKILIIDDEESILVTLDQMLKTLGYTVVSCKDGERALELYKKSIHDGNKYDLVIMDLTIPGGMGGKDTIKHLTKIDPDVKAVVSSGYSKDPIMANYQDYGFAEVVTKPYTMEELSEILYRLLY